MRTRELVKRLREMARVQTIPPPLVEQASAVLGTKIAAADSKGTEEKAPEAVKPPEPSLPAGISREELDAFGPEMSATLRAGRSLVCADVVADPRGYSVAVLKTYADIAEA